MENQWYKLNKNIIFQDNKSTLILEKNGKASNSKRTKHIKVRYFFVIEKRGGGSKVLSNREDVVRPFDKTTTRRKIQEDEIDGDEFSRRLLRNPKQ